MNRRDFLKGATFTTVGMALTAAEARSLAQGNDKKPAGAAQAPKPDDDLKGAPVKFAVIGLGQRGREILATLAKMAPFAPVVLICDKYTKESFVKKSQAIVPSAT